ncbi:MAG: penicillin-binding protein 1C [Alcaligenaceae bacterium]|nr:penicillin-binding protein 1C [Alcaligenaceae bacterium]
MTKPKKGVAASLKRRVRPRVYGVLCLGLILVLLLIVSGRMALRLSAPEEVVSYADTRAAADSSYVEVLDRQGLVLDRIRQDYTKRQGEWLSLEEVSPSFIEAILVSEDKRFYEHNGVDWWALLNATQAHVIYKIKTALGVSTANSVGRGGASGISMQLIALLDPELQTRGGRSYQQKWYQMAAALALEASWTKDEILEAYINLLPLRGEIVGVSAAAEAFYGKYAFGLNPRESALLAVMARAPNTSIAQLTKRSCDLLIKMNDSNQCNGLSYFVSYFLRRPHPEVLDREHDAPHIAQYARQWAHLHGKKSVRTTLDSDLQKQSQAFIRAHLSELSGAAVQDAAVVVLDNSSGEVLAYIGSSGAMSMASEVDHVRAPRQVASTLKPFLYAQALDERRLTAASLLNDSPINLLAGEGLYIPQNHDRSFAGWVSLRLALASSLNIPAVRTIVSLGVSSFYHKLKELHLPLERDSEFYGYSLALGAADMDLLSLTNAYRALANGGHYSALSWNQDELPAVEKVEVFSPEAAWIIGHILSDREARSYTFGLDSVLTTPFWSAVKTGTSKDMRDNWTVGWSEHYTVGVWVGNSDGSSMQNVLGVSGAGPIWHDVMRYLHRQRDSNASSKPEQIAVETVQFVGVDEAMRREYFLSGTEMKQVVALVSENYTEAIRIKIQAPVDGTILALDPDIPSHAQKLYLQANIQSTDPRAGFINWYINDIEIANGVSNLWSPNRGTHRITLKDENAKVLDEVVISVR